MHLTLPDARVRWKRHESVLDSVMNIEHEEAICTGFRKRTWSRFIQWGWSEGC
jgi:hypothetical protein